MIEKFKKLNKNKNLKLKGYISKINKKYQNKN